jgi:hypothetical protein
MLLLSRVLLDDDERDATENGDGSEKKAQRERFA